MTYKFVKILTKGDSGEEVVNLQNFLISINFDDVLINGKPKKLTADGDFGAVTAECVESVKAKSLDSISAEYVKAKYKEITGNDVQPDWLEVNSTVNPLFGLLLERWDEVQKYLGVTMQGMDLTPEPETVTVDSRQELINEVIAFEKGEIGTKEETGNNDGDRVEWYQKIGSNGEVNHGGSPYCQYGQNTSLIVSSKKLKLDYKWWYNGYTPDNVNKGKKLKICRGGNSSGGHVDISEIKAGDWGYVYSSERRNARHVFLITGKKGNNVYTIEFNTNSQGGAEGNGVFNRIRNISQVWATVRWADLYE